MDKSLKNKNICFFIASPDLGGVESTFICYANRMASLGYKVKILICHNDSLGSLISGNIHIIDLNVSRLRKSLLKLCRAIRRFKIDIMICSNVQVVFPLMAKFLCRPSMRIVSSHHFYCDNSETNFIKRAPLKIAYSLSDIVFAVSVGIKSELLNTIGVTPSKVYVIHNPIDVSLTRLKANEYTPPNAGEKSVVWVGRYSVVKNLPLLIDSFCEFWTTHPQYHLFLIGGGVLMEEMKAIISSKNCSEYIHIEGVKSNPMPYIKNASIFALSSSSEAQSVVLREALALGKNIVATPTEGAKESLADGKYGYIAESFEVKDFVKGLQIMSDHIVDEKSMNLWIQKFDIKEITEKLIKMLETL